MGGVNGVNVAIEMGGGQLTPTKKLGRVAVIDVVEVSCAQHATASRAAPTTVGLQTVAA